MTKKTKWNVTTLEDVLKQNISYLEKVSEAIYGIEAYARRDYPNKSKLLSEEDCECLATDLAICRMVELLLDCGKDPQEIYDAEFERLIRAKRFSTMHRRGE